MDGPREQYQRSSEIDAALAELSHLMLATPSVDNLLTEVAQLATQIVSPPASCGITLRRETRPWTVASSGPVAAHVDEIQYGHNEGPCLEALRTGEQVAIPDMAGEHRWGRYSAYALGFGVRSSLCLPLVVEGEGSGAMNLYAAKPQAFGEEETRRAELLAVQAAAAITLAIRQANQVKLTDQLREALATRAVIDQAIGILMAQQRCDRATAFGLLRNASQHRNRKLRDIATELVEAISGGDFAPTPFNDPE